MQSGTRGEAERRARSCRWSVVAAIAAIGCAADTRDDGFGFGTAENTGEQTSSESGIVESTSSGVTGESTGAGEEGSDIKLDVAPGADGADDGGSGDGCDKVDFLFVIDNSGSMDDEQQSLVASFGGFMSTITDTLMAQDYHVMVVDTDAESLSFTGISCVNNDCTCTPEPQCCFAMCNGIGISIQPPPTECAGQSCDEFEAPTGCPVTLGAGKTDDPLGNPCGIENGLSYMTDSQPDLAGTFECVAIVGAGGDGNERPMEAMTLALTAETSAGGCHEGFLRDDAILVVTFITDEEDTGSVGTVADWTQAVVDAKNGDETAVVVLGLLSDLGAPGGVCNDTPEDAPLLREFTESFTHGSWASVCSPSYDAFFEAAVSVIDTTCEEFVPAG